MNKNELLKECRKVGAEVMKLAKRIGSGDTGILVRYNNLMEEHKRLYTLAKACA